jgi:hypothetical protein
VDHPKGLQNRAKRVWRVYIATVDRTLTALFFFSLLALFAHDIFFAGWPELFSWGGELWDLFYALCLAFAGSYIFYFVVIHIKRQQDKENIRPFLSAKTGRICEDAKKLIGGIRGGSVMKYDPHYYPSYEEVKNLCEYINLDDPSPHISRGKHVSWIQFMTLLKYSSRQEITNIYAVSHLLDTDYLALVMAVEEWSHFAFLQMGGYRHLPNLSFFAADQMYDYIEKVRALEQYSERAFGE